MSEPTRIPSVIRFTDQFEFTELYSPFSVGLIVNSHLPCKNLEQFNVAQDQVSLRLGTTNLFHIARHALRAFNIWQICAFPTEISRSDSGLSITMQWAKLVGEWNPVDRQNHVQVRNDMLSLPVVPVTQEDIQIMPQRGWQMVEFHSMLTSVVSSIEILESFSVDLG